MKQPRSTNADLISSRHKPFFLTSFLAVALLFPFAARAGNEAFVADSSTIALYHFDAGATPGDELKDASSHALTLSATGNVQFLPGNLAWMSSPSGTAAHFSGPADKLTVNIPDNLVMPNTTGRITPFTIEARIFIRAFNAKGAGAPVISLYQNYDSFLNFEEEAGAGVEEPHLRARKPGNKGYGVIFSQRDSARTLTREEWHLFTATVAANGMVSVYVDNALISAARAYFAWDEGNDWSLMLGGFDGDLDELRLSTGVRAIPASAPVANFKSYFQEVSGTSAQLPLELDYDGIEPSLSWNTESGPGAVAFSGQSVAVVNGVKQAWVNAQFPAPGKYVIRAEVGDANATVRDYLVVKVWPASGATAGKKVLISGYSPACAGSPSALVQNMAQASGDTQSVINTDAAPDRSIESFWYQPLPGDDAALSDFHYAHFLREVISEQDWDVAVMTLSPRRSGSNASHEAQSDIFFAKIFARYLRHHGARLLICACDRSAMAAAKEIAVATQAKIAPVGTVIAAPHQAGKEAYLSAYTIFYSLFGHAPDGDFQAQMRNAVGKVIASDPALYFDTWTTP